MSTTVKWALNLTLTGGPRLAPSGTSTVEAYEVVDVTVPGDNTPVEITLGGGGGDISLFAVTAGTYADQDLFYTVNAGVTQYALDGPHIFIGSGATAHLDPVPTSIHVTNNTGADVEITVLTGRDATP